MRINTLLVALGLALAGPAAGLSAEVEFPTYGLNPIPGYTPGGNSTNVYRDSRDDWQKDARFKAYQKLLDDLPAGTATSVSNVMSVIGQVTALVTNSPAFSSAAPGNGPELGQRLVQGIDLLNKSLRWDKASKSADQPWESYLNGTFTNTANIFREQKGGGGGARIELLFFGGAREIGGPREVIFSVDLLDDDDNLTQTVYFATVEQAVEFRSATTILQRLVAMGQTAGMNQWAESLRVIDQAWDNYLGKGYAQYPWESYINSFVTPKLFGKGGRVYWERAPKHQLVVFHPEPGILLDLRDASDAEAHPALIVEGLGYIHYFGAERSWFLGMSVAGSVANSDLGLGFGPMVHFGTANLASRVPHVSLGVLWHDFNDEGRYFSEAPAVGISVDLWRLFSKDSGKELFKAVLKQ